MRLDFLCGFIGPITLSHTDQGKQLLSCAMYPLAGGKQKIARTTILKKNENETTPLCSSQKYSEPFVR